MISDEGEPVQDGLKRQQVVAEERWGLSTVPEVIKAISSGQELDVVLARLLSLLIETSAAVETGAFLLYDPVSKKLVVVASRGYEFSILQRLRIGCGEAMSGRVFKTGRAKRYARPAAIEAARANMTAENVSLLERAAEGLGPVLSAMCIPMTSGETTVGVLVLENRSRAGAFAASDLPAMQVLADLAALFVEHTRLRQEVHRLQAVGEANQFKAELISTLAHEMRTPLTAIKGYSTALLMEEASFSDGTQHEFLQIIDEECDVLQDLIHDLLESSTIDAGLLSLEWQPVLMPRLAGSIIRDLAPRARGHRFIVDFPRDFPILEADPDRIGQVLRNLLDNAVKYSPEGGLVIVRGQVAEREVMISVADQGVGIAPEHLNRLFEKFFRVKSGPTGHVVGSGLGLPIAQTIVEGHGGRIWAESKVGEGTTLFFTLPFTGLPEAPSWDRSGQSG
jgi:signal transduction histidine kinase